MRPLRYRSYKEVLGDDSDLARMLAACLRDGKTFHRGEVEHLTRDGEVRRLGVTISPIYRACAQSACACPATRSIPPTAPEMKISGALCLMSDLTELTALQKQIRWKENLAALGEMSAGIAHEFKNALATISGYAQMIRQRSQTRRHPRFRRPHPRPDALAHSRGHRISALREAARNLLTRLSRCSRSSSASPKTFGNHSRNAPFRVRGRFRRSSRRRSASPPGPAEP